MKKLKIKKILKFRIILKKLNISLILVMLKAKFLFQIIILMMIILAIFNKNDFFEIIIMITKFDNLFCMFN